jgi:hypothetical protein
VTARHADFGTPATVHHAHATVHHTHATVHHTHATVHHTHATVDHTQLGSRSASIYTIPECNAGVALAAPEVQRK